MVVDKKTAMAIRERLLNGSTAEERRTLLAPRFPADMPLKPRLPVGNDHTPEGLKRRQEMLQKQGIRLDQLSGQGPEITPAELAGNIENLIGFARIPVGVMGPLRINGSNARGDFYVPMATSEGALVASYNRGAYLVSQAGGASVLCLTESVSRAPCFLFASMSDATAFLAWLLTQVDSLQDVIRTKSSHCKFVDMRTSLIGKDLYLNFEYNTGDAAGQNMVTLVTDAVCRHLLERAPIQPLHWYVESNFSGDKKATMLSFLHARGKKVIAEVSIPGKMLKKIVHADPEDMVRYWQISVLGGAQSGSIGVQGHFANALAAVFIACGQDAACVSEAAVGLTRMDVTRDGDLYVSVTLPNVIVGSVGGGTHLPTARECLEMLGCYGNEGSRKLAEICTATALAGEISIIGALCAGEFSAAHAKYGRKHA
jgi:hydroxymethylglutaryl-CoA reductase (NADPH)